MNLDQHYELLSKLYLRLKGYFVTNLIIHSADEGNLSSEIDIVAVRFPYHIQQDRAVFCNDFLECKMDRIEILIADVKNVVATDNLKFNKGLRRNRTSIEKFINWLGCFKKIDETIIDTFERHLNLHRTNNIKSFSEFQFDNDFGKFNFKFTFFCPSLEPWNKAGFKYIDATEIFGFIWECLNQSKTIITCSRTYNFNNWNEFELYVRFFKENNQKITKEIFENWINKQA